MPRSTPLTSMARTVGGTTPFPNIWLDRVMPFLTDTEWRLICILVRQTFGWIRQNEPKRSDWLSHSQLKRKSGRASAAVSRAIDVLCRNHLIVVTDAAKRPLTDPDARRRHRGRLYFRLTDSALLLESKRIRRKRGLRKAKTTKNTHTNNVVVVAGKRKRAVRAGSLGLRGVGPKWQRLHVQARVKDNPDAVAGHVPDQVVKQNRITSKLVDAQVDGTAPSVRDPIPDTRDSSLDSLSGLDGDRWHGCTVASSSDPDKI
jgi:hypothetical protein